MAKRKLLALDTLRAAARAVVNAYRDKTATRKQRAAALDHLAMVIDRKQGRPGLPDEVVARVLALRAEGLSMPSIAKTLGIGQATVSKIVAQFKDNGSDAGKKTTFSGPQ